MIDRHLDPSNITPSLLRWSKDYLDALKAGADLTVLQRDWEALGEALAALAAKGLLDSSAASAARAVATNVLSVSSSAFALEKSFQKTKQQALDEITYRIGNIFVEGSLPNRKRSLSTVERRSKRACRSTSESPTTPPPPSTDDYPTPPSSTLSISTPLPSGTSGISRATPSKAEPDHTLVRLWFLQNLSYPYPTNAQKDKLASAAGIARSKVDSDLTNYRRRAGWTAILNEWCSGDRDAMRRLIDKVEAGKEKRQEVLDAVQGCKDYLTMKEEKTVRNDLLSNIRQAGRSSASKPKHRTTSSTSSASTGTSSSMFSSASALAGRPATPRSFSNGSMASSLSEVSAAADVFFPPTSAASTAEQAAALVAGRKRLVSNVAPGGPVTPPKRLRTAYPHFISPRDGASSSAQALASATGTSSGIAQGENGQYAFFLPPTPLTALPSSATFDAANEGTGYRTTASKAVSSGGIWSTDAALPTVAQVNGQAGQAQSQAMNWAMPDTWEFQPEVSFGWGAAMPPSGSYQ
ncbi:hypothetical protein IAT38_002708 [Cryptococcus sp. DSM 104549]